MVAQKERVIAELRDKACTLWASGWLFLWRKASKFFPGLHFDFPVPVEDEMGESEFDGEDDLGVSSAALSSAFLPCDPWSRLPSHHLPILRLFLSFLFTLVAFGPCNDGFDLY